MTSDSEKPTIAESAECTIGQPPHFVSVPPKPTAARALALVRKVSLDELRQQ